MKLEICPICKDEFRFLQILRDHLLKKHFDIVKNLFDMKYVKPKYIFSVDMDNIIQHLRLSKVLNNPKGINRKQLKKYF